MQFKTGICETYFSHKKSRDCVFSLFVLDFHLIPVHVMTIKIVQFTNN